MNEALPPVLLAASSDRFSTHRVLNQAQPASSFNAFTGDAVLRAAIAREAPWAAGRCAALGALAGDENVQELARLANRFTPERRIGSLAVAATRDARRPVSPSWFRCLHAGTSANRRKQTAGRL